MDSYEKVHEYLSRLGLTTIENTIDSYLESSHDRPVMEILDHLLSEELKHKISRKTENMLKWSGFPFHKTIDDFDFSFQPSIDRYCNGNEINHVRYTCILHISSQACADIEERL